ncbi:MULTISPECIES: DUF938 domain-containing protein [Crocosphaera]|uniref:SAM-dependent methyltransferase n=3 Tax=Crocosphaera watsonii TaxID=263511 RepID=T2JU56_CROWT|nr:MULTISPECIES: DUF938 domain-containing protein [Crocosphaera]EHJ10519.1 Protein of unknown function DUF938 [Crocosphaera watsonii WH 0003]MCH2246233.1 class I SAM-dependent methyltransferase [Crocosphaera sp.]CCQ55447.1 SAM-dependent methyltransferase [Crocosphaera watsonii WH 0005]CCQ68566.1 SAM-dependent methyltransferase [Crocosphaera watsonii WH 0402]
MDSLKQYAPATQRNREPILEVLLRVLPKSGNILEIASGTGEHSLFFAPAFSPRQWIPSDPNPMARDSIEAWRKDSFVDNIQPNLNINAASLSWGIEEQELNITTIVNINMIHISPWAACLGLMEGAKRILPSGGILYLYGPYKQGGKHTAVSNESFDQSLRSQNPEWGVRNLEDVIKVAEEKGLIFQEKVEMPANNLSVIFQKQ